MEAGQRCVEVAVEWLAARGVPQCTVYLQALRERMREDAETNAAVTAQDDDEDDNAEEPLWAADVLQMGQQAGVDHCVLHAGAEMLEALPLRLLKHFRPGVGEDDHAAPQEWWEADAVPQQPLLALNSLYSALLVCGVVVSTARGQAETALPTHVLVLDMTKEDSTTVFEDERGWSHALPQQSPCTAFPTQLQPCSSRGKRIAPFATTSGQGEREAEEAQQAGAGDQAEAQEHDDEAEVAAAAATEDDDDDGDDNAADDSCWATLRPHLRHLRALEWEAFTTWLTRTQADSGIMVLLHTQKFPAVPQAVQDRASTFTYLETTVGRDAGAKASQAAREALHLEDDWSYVYGEIRFETMWRILHEIACRLAARADALPSVDPLAGKQFVDLGAGAGKAVFAAAMLAPLHSCVGVEALEPIYEVACRLRGHYISEFVPVLEEEEKQQQLQHTSAVDRLGYCSEVQFTHALAETGDVDLSRTSVVFLHWTSWPDHVRTAISRKCAAELSVGAFVVSVTRPLCMLRPAASSRSASSARVPDPALAACPNHLENVGDCPVRSVADAALLADTASAHRDSVVRSPFRVVFSKLLAFSWGFSTVFIHEKVH